MSWNRFKLISEITSDREKAIRWSQSNGLLRSKFHCTYHKKEMLFDIEGGGFGQFRCQKKHPTGRITKISSADGSWFAGHRLSLRSMFSLMYSFAVKDSYDEAIREMVDGEQRASTETVADWYSYCREVVCERYLRQQSERGKIGGPGKIVQIDEAKFGRRKFNRGRVIEGHWLLGMIEDGSEDFRLEVCPDNRRDAETLIPLIQKNVAVGSTIVTDEWRAYSSLKDFGYEHRTVCHSYEYVSSTGDHTQRIEASWRPMRAYFRQRNVRYETYSDHVVEYQWRRWCRKNNKDMFQDLLDAIIDLYPL